MSDDRSSRRWENVEKGRYRGFPDTGPLALTSGVLLERLLDGAHDLVQRGVGASHRDQDLPLGGDRRGGRRLSGRGAARPHPPPGGLPPEREGGGPPRPPVPP